MSRRCIDGRCASIRGSASPPSIARCGLFEEANILERHDFGDGRSRYEEASEDHHDHLIDIQSGKVIEFRSPEIEVLQRQIAERHGYRLVGHRLELFGVPVGGEGEVSRQDGCAALPRGLTLAAAGC